VLQQLDCVACTVHQCAVLLKEQEGQHPLTGQRTPPISGGT